MPADAQALSLLGATPADCARLAAQVNENPASLAPIHAWKRQAGGKYTGDALERVLLRAAAAENFPRIAGLPVPEQVKALLTQEFEFYARPTGMTPAMTHAATHGTNPLEAGGYPFVTACKVISLRRFPAGPLDWEIAGFPRSWLLQVRTADLARVAWFLAARVGGFEPMFFTHVARRPKNRSLIIEKEVLRSYCRIAGALELQPGIKGILTASWFHDRAAVKNNPSLAALSRPYLEGGGLLAAMGRAPADAGFLEHNAGRKKAFDTGELQYRTGLAVWPRKAAIEWARGHRDLLER